MQTGKVFIYFFILVIKENVLQGDANPIPPRNNILYESMVSKCPEIKLINDFNKQEVFDTCSNWTKNDENITTITKINTTQALCTLYLNNFVSFCTRIREVKLNITDIRLKLIPDNVKTVDLNQEYNICTNLTKMSKFFSKHPCLKYCIDDNDTFSSQCILAEYYDSYNVSSLIQLKNNKSAVPEEKKLQQAALLDAAAAPSQVNIVSEKNSTNASSDAAQQEKITLKNVDNLSNQIQDNASVNNEAVDAVGIPAPENDKKPKLISQVPQVSPVNVQLASKIKSQAETDQTVQNIPEDQPSDNKHKPKNDQNENLPKDKEPPQPNPQQAKTNPTAKPQIPIEQSSSTKDKSPTQSGTSVQSKAPTQNDEKANDFPFPNESSLPNDKQAQIEIPGPDDGLAQNDNEDVSLNEDGDNTNDDNAFSDLDQNQSKKTTEEKSKAKPAQLDEDIPISSDDIDGESYFFSYFMVVCVLFVLGYVFYHNRTKVMALVIEGKRNRRQFRGRRPNSANYHKLDSNLEEAISSSCTKSKSNVIY